MIEELRRQIEQRLTEVCEEADRLQAALDALGHGAANATPVDVAKPRRQSRAQALGAAGELLEARPVKPSWRPWPAGTR